MELKNLRTFQAVVDQGSYQKAAEYLGYTQSTVTVHIQQLEEELGVPLFQRVGRHMTLTQAGEQALAQTRELLLAAERLSQLGLERQAPSGLPRFAAQGELADGRLVELIAPISGVRFPTLCARHKNRWVTPAMELFMRLLRETLN